MKKKIISFITICFLSLFFLQMSNNNYSPLKRIEIRIPTILNQIRELKKYGPHDLISSENINKLSNYLESGDNEFDNGMKMILNSNHYDPLFTYRLNEYKINGIISNKENTKKIIDKKNHELKSFADLKTLGAYLDKNYNLYTMFEAWQNIPKNNSIKIYIWIMVEFKKYIFMTLNPYNGELKYVYNGMNFNIKIESKVNKVIEANIPLKIIYDNLNIKMSNEIKLIGGIYHKGSGIIKKEMPTGLGWDLKWTQHDVDYTGVLIIQRYYHNYALELLLHLIKNDCYINNDSITIAIANANNYLYYIADTETKKQIKKDMVEYFKLYKDILNYQKEIGFNFSLDKLPFIPKLFWAGRHRKDELIFIKIAKNELKSSHMNLNTYMQYIDRPETIRDIFNYIKQENLLGKSFSASIKNLETWVYDHRKYRRTTDIKEIKSSSWINEEEKKEIIKEIENGICFVNYKGKTWQWHTMVWLNYHWNERFKKNKIIYGACGTERTIQMGFFRAAGIAPAALSQGYDNPSVWPGGHGFPAAYNPVTNRWHIYQKIDIYYKGYKPEPIAYLSFVRPFFHYTNWNWKLLEHSEKTNNKNLANITHIGINNYTFEEAFYKSEQFKDKSGPIFNKYIKEDILYDTDQDGFADVVEKELNLDHNNFDSDGDNYSDYWELDNGYNPLNKNIPKDKLIIAIDGFTNDLKERKNIIYKEDKSQDAKNNNSNTIKSIIGYAEKNYIYIGVDFDNVVIIPQNVSIIIKIEEKEKLNYMIHARNSHIHYFSIYPDGVNANDYAKQNENKIKYFEHKFRKAAEWKIPASFFKDSKQIKIKCVASSPNYWDNDQTEWININLVY